MAGVRPLLTSGGEQDAATGATCLAELVPAAQSRIGIMAGGGVRLENVKDLVLVSGVREIHTSLRRRNGDRHEQRKEPIIGATSEPLSRSSVREEDVSAMRTILDEIEEFPVP